jgi:hypothetical protein
MESGQIIHDGSSCKRGFRRGPSPCRLPRQDSERNDRNFDIDCQSLRFPVSSISSAKCHAARSFSSAESPWRTASGVGGKLGKEQIEAN